MKIVMLDGGFANQITQYIFARCLQEVTNEPVYLDDLYFHVPNDVPKYGEVMSPYQLDKFPNIKKVPLLSEYFDKDVWEEMRQSAMARGNLAGGSWMPQILKDGGLDFFMIAETSLFKFDGMVAKMPYYYYIPEMLEAQGNTYYFGWYTNGGWFMRHEEMFRHELALPPLRSNEDIEMIQLIENSYSIGVHVRCAGGYKAMGNIMGADYYKTNLKQICNYLKAKGKTLGRKPHIFIFSDDIQFCKDNASEFGFENLPYPVTFAQSGRSDHDRVDNHYDLQLMAMCDMLLLCNSVYGYMAALLNQKPNKIVLNPIASRGVFGFSL